MVTLIPLPVLAMAACHAGSRRAMGGRRRALVDVGEVGRGGLVACKTGCLTTPQKEGGKALGDGPTCDMEVYRRGLGGAERLDAVVDTVVAGLPTRQMDGGMTSSSKDEQSD